MLRFAIRPAFVRTNPMTGCSSAPRVDLRVGADVHHRDRGIGADRPARARLEPPQRILGHEEVIDRLRLGAGEQPDGRCGHAGKLAVVPPFRSAPTPCVPPTMNPARRPRGTPVRPWPMRRVRATADLVVELRERPIDVGVDRPAAGVGIARAAAEVVQPPERTATATSETPARRKERLCMSLPFSK